MRWLTRRADLDDTPSPLPSEYPHDPRVLHWLWLCDLHATPGLPVYVIGRLGPFRHAWALSAVTTDDMLHLSGITMTAASAYRRARRAADDLTDRATPATALLREAATDLMLTLWVISLAAGVVLTVLAACTATVTWVWPVGTFAVGALIERAERWLARAGARTQKRARS